MKWAATLHSANLLAGGRRQGRVGFLRRVGLVRLCEPHFSGVPGFGPGGWETARQARKRALMDAEKLRAVQAPIKDHYRSDPAAAIVTLHAQGRLDDPEGLSCSVETGRALVTAGLHPATGGDGLAACSGDMLLQALVACAGVTLRAVATATGIPVRGGTVQAAGDLDFRGTLGVDRTAPVGFVNIRLTFDLDTDAAPDQIATLKKLTERYCVVYQTLANGVAPQTEFVTRAAAV